MNILLVCAGGMSTSILMKKMEKFWAEKGVDLNIKAVGVSAYEENAKDFDVILMGPQVRYKLDEVKEDRTSYRNDKWYGLRNGKL